MGKIVEKDLVKEESQPWDPIEGKLVKYSIISGVIALIVLGILINIFLLH